LCDDLHVQSIGGGFVAVPLIGLVEATAIAKTFGEFCGI
jgi:hypothetical protein